jgi:hypothetical protein
MKNVRICGDDLIARWGRETAEEYFISISKLGLVINLEKTIRSETGGVFVGQYFRVTEPAGRKGRSANLLQRSEGNKQLKAAIGPYLARLPRATLSSLLLAKRKEDIEGENFNILTILGDAIRDSARGAPTRMRNRVLTVSKWFWSRPLARMRKSPLPVHLPCEYGGWGIPGKYDAPHWWRKAIANLLALAPEDRPSLADTLKQVDESPFETSVGRLAGRVTDLMKTAADGTFAVEEIPEGRVPDSRPKPRTSILDFILADAAPRPNLER